MASSIELLISLQSTGSCSTLRRICFNWRELSLNLHISLTFASVIFIVVIYISFTPPNKLCMPDDENYPRFITPTILPFTTQSSPGMMNIGLKSSVDSEISMICPFSTLYFLRLAAPSISEST